MSSFTAAEHRTLRRVELVALCVGLLGCLACAVGFWLTPVAFFRAYLATFLYVLGLAHGCFVLLMLYFLTGGAWGFLIRRVLEAGMRTLPLVLVLFLPIGFGMGYLYLWARPEVVDSVKLLQQQRIYSNPVFFWVRA